MALPPPSAPTRSSQRTPQPPGGRQIVNREPSVGSDRYEEIIVETRKRSQSRSRMGSRTSSVVDFRKSNSALIDTIRSVNNKAVVALDLDTKNDASKIVASKLSESPVLSKRLPVVSAPVIKKPEVV